MHASTAPRPRLRIVTLSLLILTVLASAVGPGRASPAGASPAERPAASAAPAAGGSAIASLHGRSAHLARLCPGGTIRYTIDVENESLPANPNQPLTLVAELDPATSYVGGSATGGATYNAANHAVELSLQMASSQVATVAFSVTVASAVAFNKQLVLAVTGALGSEALELTLPDTVRCGAQVFLPLVSGSAAPSMISFQRRAAQVIEEARNTENAPNWAQAQLDGTAQPLYRPDVPGVAYYEFGVAPEGFIIVATGPHDMQIPHWNNIGDSPSEELKAEAQTRGQTATKFYKIDAAAYVAENASGDLVATISQLPAKMSGYDQRWIDQEQRITEVTSQAATPVADDANAAGVPRLIRSSGPISAPIQLSGWASWQELKAGYAATYAPLLAVLSRDAAVDWEIIDGESSRGAGIRVGDTYSMALPDATATATLSGITAANVRLDRVNRTGLPPILTIEVLSNPTPGTRARFTVLLSAAGGAQREHVPFFIIDPIPQAQQARSGWSAWTTYSAGSEADQRDYNQFTVANSCASGCGPTAWAMLFGWADFRVAQGSSYWAGRWGLYRQNGGYGNNAVAPKTRDTGINNIILEIRNHVDTFCVLDNGATETWKMERANRYLTDRSVARISTHYNVLMFHQNRLRGYARDSIRDRDTPVIVGTGHLAISHYPLAWKFRYRSDKRWWGTKYEYQFYLNNGWSGTSGDGWVNARTWFAGELYPN